MSLRVGAFELPDSNSLGIPSEDQIMLYKDNRTKLRGPGSKTRQHKDTMLKEKDKTTSYQ